MNLLHDKLTEQERQVIKGWCDGLTNPEIRAAMHIAEKTLGSYRWRILSKLGATSPRHAAYLWGRGEVIAPERWEIEDIVTLISKMAGKIAMKRSVPS